MEKYVSFSEILKSSDQMSEVEKITLIDNNNEDEQIEQKLFQVLGIKDTDKAYVAHIGFGIHRPKILLKEFNFQGYNCKIVSYVLNNKDIEESNKSKNLKMIGLLFTKNNIVKAAVSIELKTSNDIINSISDNTIKKELDGEYIVYFRKNENDEGMVLHVFETYPGNNNMVEKLIKFLTHEQILSMYD